MADGYRAQVAPGLVSGALPFRNESDYGGAVGDALQRAGAVQAQTNVRNTALEAQREWDRQATQALVDYAQLKQDYSSEEIEAKANAGPGASGYHAARTKSLADREKAFLGTIADVKLRERYRGRFAEWRAERSIDAEAFERGKTVQLNITNIGTASDMKANELAAPDKTTNDYALAVKEFTEGIADLEGVPFDLRDATAREGVQKMTRSFLLGRPPQEAQAMLDSGSFNGILTPEQRESLASNIGVEIRREKLEQEAAAKAEAADAKEELDQFLRELGDGIPKSDEEVAAMQAKAGTYGFDKQGYDLGKARVQGRVNREYRTANPAQLDAAVKALDATIARAGDKAKPEDVIARDQLASILATRSADYRADPQAAAAKMGYEFGPLDPSDPGAIAARKREVAAASAATGVPVPFLSDEQAEQMRANIGSAQGRLAAVQLARGIGGPEGAAVIRQIAPDNGFLLHAVGLPGGYVTTALNGRDLLERKVVVLPKDFDAQVTEQLGGSLRLLGAPAQDGIRQTARALYASYSMRDGVNDEDVDRKLLSGVVAQALGGTSKAGGLGEWNGRTVALPPRMNQVDFERRLMAIAATDAYFGDRKTKISGAKLRADFVPIAVGSSRYQFMDASGRFALNASGRPWTLDLATIAPLKPAPQKARPNPTGPVFVAPPPVNTGVRGPVYIAPPAKK